MPPKATVSIIISAHKDSRHVAKIIEESKRVSSHAEVLVVYPASPAVTKEEVRMPGVRTLYITRAISHEANWQISAKHTSGDILLFLQDDRVIPAVALQKFVQTVSKGWDIALSGHTGKKKTKQLHPLSIVRAKKILNKLVNRSDLAGSSLIDYPHAISRKALDVIHSSTPPIAQVKAILGGLKITKVQNEDISFERNTRTIKSHTKKVLGDHLEAFAYVMSKTDQRAGNPDFERQRELLTIPGNCHLRRIVSGGEQWSNFW